MSTIIGIAVVGLIVWASYVGRIKVVASKRYATRRDSAPELGHFAKESKE
jgi:hypothetical protein